MKSTTCRILELLDDPQQLEVLYRQDPEAFRVSLDEASRAAGDSVTLRVWQARLDYRGPECGAQWRRQLLSAIAIALIGGALVRLPALWLGEDWYYPRLAPLWVVMALGAYFWIKRPNTGLLIGGLGLSMAVIVYVSLLPDYTDSVVMALTYLGVAFAAGENPFINRSFLITFNGLLLVVLGISVFSLVERSEKSDVNLIDYINLALVAVTLLIDAIALSAILFRLASFGFTPNRVAVLGADLIIMVHLARILFDLRRPDSTEGRS